MSPQRYAHGTTHYLPHVYLAEGDWWVLCKHGNRTGPYRAQATAIEAARDIWVEPSELHWFCEKVARSERFDREWSEIVRRSNTSD